MAEFKNINFIYQDAEDERIYAPELIDLTFVDINGILEQIRFQRKFIVSGPKGSGKSALAAKLSRMTDWNFFVETDILENFEYSLLEKTGAEKKASIGGATATWQLLLSLRIIPMILKDEGFRRKNNNIVKFYNSLKKYGLISSENLTEFVQHTSRRGAFSSFNSAFLEAGFKRNNEENHRLKDPAALLSSIKEFFSHATTTDSTYYLVLDGLDYILRGGQNNLKYIADLISAVRDLNIFFSQNKFNAKVIILIRNEIINILPDPNLTKRLNDNGIILKWYDNSRKPFESSLLKIIENRAVLAGFEGDIKSLWGNWFPEKIHGKETLDFMIPKTRYLPRDMISIFREIQKIKNPPFKENDVLAALKNYSDWFLGELNDALVGMVTEPVRTNLRNIVADLGKEFTLYQLREKLDEYKVLSPKEDEKLIAREMFEASWIGNKWEEYGRFKYQWKHRNEKANLMLDRNFVTHPGLLKSLNLV